MQNNELTPEQLMLAMQQTGGARIATPDPSLLVYQGLVDKLGGDQEFTDVLLANNALRNGLRHKNDNLINSAADTGDMLVGYDNAMQSVVSLDPGQFKRHATYGGMRNAIYQTHAEEALLNNSGLFMSFGIGVAQGMFIDPMIAVRELFYSGAPSTEFARLLYDASDYANNVVREVHPLMFWSGLIVGNIATIAGLQELTAARVAAGMARLSLSSKVANRIGMAVTSILAGAEEAALTPEEYRMGGFAGQFAFGAVGGGALTYWQRGGKLKRAVEAVQTEVVGLKTGESTANSAAIRAALDDATMLAESIKRKALGERGLFKTSALAGRGKTDKVVELADKVKGIVGKYQATGALSVDSSLDELAVALGDLFLEADTTSRAGSIVREAVGRPVRAAAVKSRLANADELLQSIAQLSTNPKGAGEALLKLKLANHIIDSNRYGDLTLNLANNYLEYVEGFVKSTHGIFPTIEFVPEMAKAVPDSALKLAKSMVEILGDTEASRSLTSAIATDDPVQITRAIFQSKIALGTEVNIAPDTNIANVAGAMLTSLGKAIGKLGEDADDALRLTASKLHAEIAYNAHMTTLGDKQASSVLTGIIARLNAAARGGSSEIVEGLSATDYRAILGVIADDPIIFRNTLFERYNSYVMNIPGVKVLDNANATLIENARNGMLEEHALHAPSWRAELETARSVRQAEIDAAKAKKAAKLKAARDAKKAAKAAEATSTASKAAEEWIGVPSVAKAAGLDPSNPQFVQRMTKLVQSKLYAELASRENMTKDEFISAIKAFFEES